jgi:hypothetical protein
MDRRDFFKTIFATPLMAPYLLGSLPSANDELFLIHDRPSTCLPEALKKLRASYPPLGQTFSISNTHPQKISLSHALKADGWTQASSLREAVVNISFRPLQHPTPPSFTLVRAGKIWDVRKKGLFYFWQEMNKKHPPSSCLTIATLQTRSPGRSRGKSIRFFHNGRVVDEVSLHKDRIQTFRSEQGSITVNIEQGNAFVSSSSCHHKICCSVPPSSFSGDRIVCAPNHFLLEIQGARLTDTIIG